MILWELPKLSIFISLTKVLRYFTIAVRCFNIHAWLVSSIHLINMFIWKCGLLCYWNISCFPFIYQKTVLSRCPVWSDNTRSTGNMLIVLDGHLLLVAMKCIHSSIKIMCIQMQVPEFGKDKGRCFWSWEVLQKKSNNMKDNREKKQINVETQTR